MSSLIHEKGELWKWRHLFDQTQNIEFEELEDLVELRATPSSCLYCLPPSIVCLTKLKKLDLIHAKLPYLPNAIADLPSLEYLALDCRRMRSLPSWIGRLKNLKTLVLIGIDKMDKFPTQIRELTALTELILKGSRSPKNRTSKNRIKVYVARKPLDHPFELPSEIGDLVNLNTLILDDVILRSLPTAIRGLKNLKILSLDGKTQLTKLPKWICELSKLEELHLEGTGVTSLPDSIGTLKNLQRLKLPWSMIFECQPGWKRCQKLVSLAKRCPSLWFLGDCAEEGKTTLTRILAHNWVGLNVGLGTTREAYIRRAPNLWPRMLQNAIDAFKRPTDDGGDELPLGVKKADAVYYFLEVGRESFLSLLVERNSNF